MRDIKRVTVFSGSSQGKSPIYMEQAKLLGDEIAKRSMDLCYGGGSVGLMGACARAVNDGGRKVVSVIPRALMPRELSGESIGQVIVTEGMHERKSIMADHADAFIALPGGFGTMEELMEVVTWAQLGIHNKPIGLLNTQHFWDPYVAMIDSAVSAGFIQPKFREVFVVAESPSVLLDKLVAHIPVAGVTSWLAPTQI